MNGIMKRSGLVAGLIVLLAVNGWCAGEKLAVLDFERALKEYYKTKPAEAEIDRQKQDFKIDIERRIKNLDQLQEKYEAAREETRNKALNDEGMKTKLADAEKKLMELKEYQQEVKKFSDQEKKRIVEDSMRIRKRFTEDILDVVKKCSAEKGLLAVMDSSSAIEELRGAVLYCDSSADITDAVVKILNESKPAATVAKPETKK